MASPIHLSTHTRGFGGSIKVHEPCAPLHTPPNLRKTEKHNPFAPTLFSLAFLVCWLLVGDIGSWVVLQSSVLHTWNYRSSTVGIVLHLGTFSRLGGSFLGPRVTSYENLTDFRFCKGRKSLHAWFQRFRMSEDPGGFDWCRLGLPMIHK